MNSLRILVLSNTRPSRSWRLARRLAREVPGVEICGIVQRPVSALPIEQQWIATARTSSPGPGWLSRLRSWTQACLESVVHGVLWFVHGCPRKLNARPSFDVQTLAKHCAQQGWPLLRAAKLDEKNVADFAGRLTPDLIVALGEVSSLPEISPAPLHGWIRVRVNGVLSSVADATQGLHIRVEHLARASGPVRDLACLTLPRQACGSSIGFTLKSDLVADDTLTHAVAGIREGGASQAVNEVARWVDEILSPYLAQLGPSRAVVPPSTRRWYRSVWSLSVETLFLCSPVIVARNWLRRLRGRYPVLILVHHLVSDRPHRMSISTEAFWRQVLFLRRHYRFVSLSEASELLHSGRTEFPAVSLTFDDGYADNFISLRAVAEETGIPVSLFITTQPIELHKEFQHDVTKGQHGAFPMTWAQIRYWKERGAEFGSHTRNHIKCGVADRALLQEEIVGSKIDFERRLGEMPQFFAFPYGNREDLPPQAIEIAASAYPHFLSAYGGENFPDQIGDNTHLFRKNAYPEPWELELELQSVFDQVDTAKRTLRLSQRRPRHLFEQPNHTPELATLESALDFEKGPNQLLAEPSQAIQRMIKPS
jgi:peptidoglycan/xylan/chitin deacetylase (PgdA/CDA1 family)